MCYFNEVPPSTLDIGRRVKGLFLYLSPQLRKNLFQSIELQTAVVYPKFAWICGTALKVTCWGLARTLYTSQAEDALWTVNVQI